MFCLKSPYAVKGCVWRMRKQALVPQRTCHCMSFSTSGHTICKQKTMNEVIYQRTNHNIKKFLLSAKYPLKWIQSLRMVCISVDSVMLRNLDLHSCIIDDVYTAFLIRKTRWAYPTVHPNWIIKVCLRSFLLPVSWASQLSRKRDDPTVFSESWLKWKPIGDWAKYPTLTWKPLKQKLWGPSW